MHCITCGKEWCMGYVLDDLYEIYIEQLWDKSRKKNRYQPEVPIQTEVDIDNCC